MGGLGMIFFWLLIILLIPAVLKYLRTDGVGRRGSEQPRTALDYLEEAYAKGEISREEFLQKREDLRSK
jgi:putative membrane protein